MNDDWQTGGCMDAIKKNLGYRFVLQNAIFPVAPTKAGTQLAFTVNLKNIGYASPYNPRTIKLVMRNKINSKEFVFDINIDIRKWHTGSVTFNAKIVTDPGMPAGDYDLYLFMPDTSESLAQRSEYAIRLANENVWEEATGYNSLGNAVKIK